MRPKQAPVEDQELDLVEEQEVLWHLCRTSPNFSTLSIVEANLSPNILMMAVTFSWFCRFRLAELACSRSTFNG